MRYKARVWSSQVVASDNHTLADVHGAVVRPENHHRTPTQNRIHSQLYSFTIVFIFYNCIYSQLYSFTILFIHNCIHLQLYSFTIVFILTPSPMFTEQWSDLDITIIILILLRPVFFHTLIHSTHIHPYSYSFTIHNHTLTDVHGAVVRPELHNQFKSSISYS